MDKAANASDKVTSLENISPSEKKCEITAPPTGKKGIRPTNNLLKGTKSSTARSNLQKYGNDRNAKINSR